MKENSTEEDIKVLENAIKCNEKQFEEIGVHIILQNDEQEAIEHILSDYKRVLKENEELNLKYYMLYTGEIENLNEQEVKIKSQVIPVQKVKDKIKEYKNMLKTCNKAKDIDRIKAINERISELQELLEGRK